MLDGWVRIEIAGKPADLFDPGGAARFALLFLHPESGATPASNAAYTAQLQRLGLACVAPHVARSWWVDRNCTEFDSELTAEQHILHNVVPWMESRWNLGPRGVAVAGIGMGGQGAVRLGLKYPDRFPVVASVAGAFDFHELHGHGTSLEEMYDTRERCRQDTAILHLDPYRWPPHIWFACDPESEWHRGNDRLHEKLTAYGVPHSVDLDSSADADAMARPMIEFVVNGLERESRRLI